MKSAEILIFLLHKFFWFDCSEPHGVVLGLPRTLFFTHLLMFPWICGRLFGNYSTQETASWWKQKMAMSRKPIMWFCQLALAFFKATSSPSGHPCLGGKQRPLRNVMWWSTPRYSWNFLISFGLVGQVKSSSFMPMSGEATSHSGST